MMKKVILVTGGAGFIGSHLIEKLVSNPDYRIFSLDNYFTGSPKNHIAGADKEYSILEIAEMFGGEIEMSPARKGDRPGSKIDHSKMLALGWRAGRDVAGYIKEIKNKKTI